MANVFGIPDEQLTAEQKAVIASADAYAQLVRATSDICTAKYHYYCEDGAAELPREMVFVANTRPIPIRDNDWFRPGNDTGALEASQVADRRKNAMRFSPVKDDNGSQLRQWKKAVHEDLQKIEAYAADVTYICLPEFAFPFGLNHTKSLELPDDVDLEWAWLKDTEFLKSRFVCLGSAHRSYRRSKSKPSLQYENVAVVYPSGKDKLLDAESIFFKKLGALNSRTKISGVDFSIEAGNHAINARFPDQHLSATLRSHLSSDEVVGRVNDEAVIQYAKDAFDFYNSTAPKSDAEKIDFPKYILKKSAARKLGEYIDAEGQIELDAFVTKTGVLSVLICYDAFDPSIFLSAVRLYYENLERQGGFIHPAVDVFFVPAFNRSTKFIKMCETLSRETWSIVVYVSGDKRCKVKSQVYACGRSLEDWAKDMFRTEGAIKGYSKQHIAGSDHLHVYRIEKNIVNYARQCLSAFAPDSIRNAQILKPRKLDLGVLG